MIPLTLTAELYRQGFASQYAPNHQAWFDAKQVGKRLIIYPYTLLGEVFPSKWPTTLSMDEEPVQISASAIFNLGVFERPLVASIMASATPLCFCAMQKHLTAKRARSSRA
jgi:hypothetical protein